MGRRKSRRFRGGKKGKRRTRRRGTGRRWVTALEAGQYELSRTGSFSRARTALQRQALYNARKLFGSIGEGK